MRGTTTTAIVGLMLMPCVFGLVAYKRVNLLLHAIKSAERTTSILRKMEMTTVVEKEIHSDEKENSRWYMFTKEKKGGILEE